MKKIKSLKKFQIKYTAYGLDYHYLIMLQLTKKTWNYSFLHFFKFKEKKVRTSNSMGNKSSYKAQIAVVTYNFIKRYTNELFLTNISAHIT